MLSNKEIIEHIHNTPDYRKAVRNITKGNELADDLYSELLLIISDYDNVTLNNLLEKEQLVYFWVRICMNQWHSNTSPFYTKYRKDNREKLYYEIEDNRIAEPDTEEFKHEPYENVVERVALDALDDMYWYDKKLFELYLELGTYKEVSEQTRIPFGTVGTTLGKVKKKLKKEINKELERLGR